MSIKPPDWLSIGPESTTITLSRPTELNGVRQNRITLRIPTVGDLRAAEKRHGKDNTESPDVFLFALLADCAPGDIEKLSVRDYKRVQAGCFRLVAEDHAAGTASEETRH